MRTAVVQSIKGSHTVYSIIVKTHYVNPITNPNNTDSASAHVFKSALKTLYYNGFLALIYRMKRPEKGQHRAVIEGVRKVLTCIFLVDYFIL